MHGAFLFEAICAWQMILARRLARQAGFMPELR